MGLAQNKPQCPGSLSSAEHVKHYNGVAPLCDFFEQQWDSVARGIRYVTQ